jgi:hypothetical protein
MRGALPLVLASLAVIGCSSNKTKSPEPVPAAETRTPLAASASGDGLTGKVLERLDAPPYSYLRLETAKGEVWAAVPEAKTEKGTTVTVFNAMMMANFESKTLKRTFPAIYFGTLTPTGADAGAVGGNPHAGVPQASASVAVGKVEKAAGADARSISEVWTQKESLKGKTVTIRGMVVKYNDGVMGKNWIHLQDGSGDAKQGTNDITVTSLDAVAKGEVVTIQGTVRTDKDFGAGYVYAIIVADAKVVKK